MGKSVKIFEYSQGVDSSIYGLVSAKADFAADWSAYFSSLSGVSKWLADSFPLLSYHRLPTSRPSLSFISGDLIPSEELRIYGASTATKMHISLSIFAVIPIDFSEIGIKIYDSTRCILWENIPYDIQHRFWLKENGFTRIFSHRKDDLEGMTPQKIIINCLQSTWHLYTEYRRYETKREFDLECHPHGERKNG